MVNEPVTNKELKLLPVIDEFVASRLYPPTFRLLDVLKDPFFALISKTALVPTPSFITILFPETATFAVKLII